MNVISLKEYAKQHNISYEAVRQQVARYAGELGAHIIRDGRQQFLDEEAVAFLDGKRQKNPVVIVQQDKDEQIEALKLQVEQLLAANAEQANRIAALAEWKADNAVAIAEANHRQQLLEASQARINVLEAQNADLSAENEAQRVKMAETEKKASEDVQKARNELEAEKKKLEDENHLLQNELQAEKQRRISLKEFWRRRRNAGRE